jgi:HD-GYP domain-containing protein (c-di-GMP phosphodiesterase class II)
LPQTQICAVADYYDALTMDRPYRVAFAHEQALDMMREIERRHFDPEVLAAFSRYWTTSARSKRRILEGSSGSERINTLG